MNPVFLVQLNLKMDVAWLAIKIDQRVAILSMETALGFFKLRVIVQKVSQNQILDEHLQLIIRKQLALT